MLSFVKINVLFMEQNNRTVDILYIYVIISNTNLKKKKSFTETSLSLMNFSSDSSPFNIMHTDCTDDS